MNPAAQTNVAHPDDARLIKRLKAHDPAAFIELFSRFGATVFRLARMKLGDVPSAEDATQEVFVRAFTKIDTLTADRVLPWLMRVARNHCCDVLRKRGRVPETPTDPTDDRFDGVVDATPETSSLPEMLRGLTEVEREVVLLRVQDEVPYGEIASALDMTEGSVRNVYSRAIRRLRENGGDRD